MGHLLDETKGFHAIAYTGETPWHGYGQRKQPGQSLLSWIKDAGADYEVLERPVVWNPYLTFEDLGNPDGANALIQNHLNYKVVPKRKLLVRSDTRTPLSIVGKDYKIVQPRRIILFFEDLIHELGFEMHTAGVLAGGNRVWGLAKVGKEFTVGLNDKVEGYLLLATSYDGKFSTTCQFTSVRVVCNNTLTWSLDTEGHSNAGVVRIPHKSEFKPKEVKQELGLLKGAPGFDTFEEDVRKLAEVKVTKKQAVEFFLELLGVTEDEAAEGKQLINARKLISFYESGPGSNFMTAKNTTWGLVNAVTFFTDHGRRAHNNGTRFNSAAFGEGAKMKRKAWNKALELADAA